MTAARPDQSTSWEIRLLGDSDLPGYTPVASRIHRVLRKGLNQGGPEGQVALTVARLESKKLQVAKEVEVVQRWLDYTTQHFEAIEDGRLREEALAAFEANQPPDGWEEREESEATKRPVNREGVVRIVRDAAKTLAWELDKDQEAGAIDVITMFVVPEGPLRTTRHVATLGGYAGTGKTVLLRLIAFVGVRLGIPVMVLTPTGKAGARMREVLRGTPGLESLPVLTIHSALYGRPTEMGRCPAEGCGEWSSEILEIHPDDMGGYRRCPACRAAHAAHGVLEQRILFNKPRVFCGDGTWILIDECTMVGEDVGEHLLSTIGGISDCHILATGDPGQLGPVKAKMAFNMLQPDVLLTRIHRQGEGNPILALAERLRRPLTTVPWLLSELRAVFGDRGEASARIHANVSITTAASWLGGHLRNHADATLITHSNKTRVACNNAVRAWANLPTFQSPTPQGPALPAYPSERLLCLANNGARGIMNGEVHTVESIEYVAPIPPEFRAWVPEHTLCRVKFVGVKDPVYVFGDTFEDSPMVPDSSNVFRGRLAQLHRSVEHAFRQWLRVLRKSPDTPQGLREAPDDDPSLLMMFLDCFGDLVPENFLHVTYGYCLTVYKSQGSQWRHVGLAWDYAFGRTVTSGDGQKLGYTAVTRAAVSLDVFALRSGSGGG